MPGDEDEILIDEGTPNEGLEAEADAAGEDADAEVGGLDAEGAAEGDGADAQEGQVDGEPPRKRGASDTIRELRASRKTETEARLRLEGETRELKERLARLEQPRQQAPQGPTPEQLALMTPDELIDHKLGIANKRFEAQLGQIQWNTYEASDKATFNSLKATDPLAAKYADEVETRLAQMRQQGQNVDRERLLTFIIGEKARAGRGAARTKQAAQGQQRIARQTVRPGAARSDTAGNRGKVSEQEARDKRLENMTF